jgi:hypothetical protein
MAREIREVLVCDVCGSDKDVAAVTLTVDGGKQNGELCAEHRRALDEAVAGILGGARPKATKRVAAKRTQQRGSTARPVTCPHCGVEMSVQNLSRHIAAKHPNAS